MTSLRKRKKLADAQGLSVRELELLELVDELLDAHRWLQVLGYANQFLLQDKLKVSQADRDRVLEAATRTVDKDARLADWRARVDRLRQSMRALSSELPSERSRGAARPSAERAAPREDAQGG